MAWAKKILARRMEEHGVPFIQLYSGGSHNDDNRNAHGDLENKHNKHAGNPDKPITDLLKDLKQRGHLDEVFVVWGGEFGRQPMTKYARGTGRDHNSAGFTMWMTGGGIKGGVSAGETDELGSAADERPLEVKHLHATILHQPDFDPNELFFHNAGLNGKLVGVEGADPISEIIA